MDLKRCLIAAIASLFVICGSVTVQAGKYETLEENVKVAQARYTEAKERLRLIAGTLFDVFMSADDIHVRHAAEAELRARYPEQYNNYIEAAIELDNAEYAIYIARIDEVSIKRT